MPPGWNEWYGARRPDDLPDVGLHPQRERRAGTPTARQCGGPALYQTDVYSRKAVDFIDARANQPDPFFLSVGFLAPHHEEAPIRNETGRTVRPPPRHKGARAPRRFPARARSTSPTSPTSRRFAAATPRG